MTKSSHIAIYSLALALTSCQTNTQTGILAGGALGAGTGALIDGGTGALVGGAIGVIGGALVGSALDAQEKETLQRQSPETVNRIENNQQLTIDDIIKMSKAGISDDSIISLIQKTGSRYRMTTRKIERLQKAGVSQKVINYMIST